MKPKELPEEKEREVRVMAVAMLKLASFFKKKREEEPPVLSGVYRIILSHKEEKVIIGYGWAHEIPTWTKEYDGLIEAIYKGLPSDEEP